DGDTADDGGDDGERPDGAVRGEVAVVQTAEAAAELAILAHGVGDAGAGVHAGERGTDEGEEDGRSLEEHEGAAMAGAEEGVADDDHHVADGSGGAGGAL